MAQTKTESLLGVVGAALIAMPVLTVFILKRPVCDWHPIFQI